MRPQATKSMLGRQNIIWRLEWRLFGTYSLTVYSQHLQTVRLWMKKNGMELNMNKSKQMIIKRSRIPVVHEVNQELDMVSTMRILGVTWQEDLTWNLHFSRVLTVATQRLYALRQLRTFLPKKALLTVYHAQVMSVILYAAPLFGELSSSVTKKITRLERRPHRTICGKDCECAFTETC